MKNYLIIIAVVIVLAIGYFFGQQVISSFEDVGGNMPDQSKEQPLDNGAFLLKGENKLDLSRKNLSRIPSDVFGRTGLVELNVSHNSISGAIQGEVRFLKELRVLNASYNQMTGVPAEIGQLENLEILDLSSNKITGLPLELGNLKKIKTINLSGNSYSKYDLDLIRARLPGVNFILD